MVQDASRRRALNLLQYTNVQEKFVGRSLEKEMSDEENDLTFDDLEGLIPAHLMKIIWKDAETVQSLRKIIEEYSKTNGLIPIEKLQKIMEKRNV